MQGANVIGANKMMEQNKLVVFTRWTIPTMQQGTPWLVDVLDHRFLDPCSKMGGNLVMPKAGLAPSRTKKDSKVTLKVLKADAKGPKSQKLWTKQWDFDHPCDAITFMTDNGKEVPMEIVAGLQRPRVGWSCK